MDITISKQVTCDELIDMLSEQEQRIILSKLQYKFRLTMSLTLRDVYENYDDYMSVRLKNALRGIIDEYGDSFADSSRVLHKVRAGILNCGKRTYTEYVDTLQYIKNKYFKH